MKHGFIAYGILKPEFNKKPLNEIHKVMDEVKKIVKEPKISEQILNY